jgi:diguanylate cyclase (GGDEF)-like protein
MKKPFQNQEFRPFYIALVIVTTFLICQVIFIYIPVDPDIRLIISDISSPLINLLTTVSIFFAYFKTKEYSRPLSKAWLYLGFAQTSFFLGDFIWGIFEVGFNISPFPSIADIAYLIYYPLFFYAIWQFPTVEQRYYEVINRSIDLIMIIIGGMVVFWNYIIGPISQTQTDVSLLTQFLAFAYPIGDLILFGAIVLFLFNRVQEKNSGPMLLVSIGIAVTVVVDCIFSIQSLTDSYQAGGLVDIGYLIPNLMVLLGAIWQYLIAGSLRKPDLDQHTLIKAINNSFNILPFVFLFFSIVMLIQSHFQPILMTSEQLSILTFVYLILFFTRHAVNNQQIRFLAREIETANLKISKQTRELHHDTLHDYLTGLPNRLLFMDRLDRLLLSLQRNKNESFALLFLDLDSFKKINDTKGHNFGDILLIHVAKRLETCIRSTDTVARLGGDEFLILLEEIADSKVVINLTNRIIEACKRPFEFNDEKINISVSIGIVMEWEEKVYENSTEILRDADIALYQAKSQGKSSYAIFDNDLLAKSNKKMLIETELRQATESEQFFIQYQPIISLTDDHIIGFEALLRWNNPLLGLVMPDKFIPVAEATGLIIPIGEWVLGAACKQMKAWQNQFQMVAPLSVNINVSGIQLLNRDFIKTLTHALVSSGLHPGNLKLEITESVLLNIMAKESNLFNELKDIGVHIQIDDFGTGYSSLSYLQHIPVDVIKIDRSFVQRICTNDKNLGLVKAIINMARGMGMQTTAEGIETDQQRLLLESIGCDNGQGYLWSKPVDAAKVEALIQGRDINTDFSVA